MLIVYFHPSHYYSIINIPAEERRLHVPQKDASGHRSLAVTQMRSKCPTSSLSRCLTSSFSCPPTAGEENVWSSHDVKTFRMLFSGTYPSGEEAKSWMEPAVSSRVGLTAFYIPTASISWATRHPTSNRNTVRKQDVKTLLPKPRERTIRTEKSNLFSIPGLFHYTVSSPINYSIPNLFYS